MLFAWEARAAKYTLGGGQGKLFASGARVATRYTLSDGQGRCLDGTLGAYYLSMASASTRQWYIYHEGGGFCSDLLDCLERSNSSLGSSRSAFWPPHLDLDAQEPLMGCVPCCLALLTVRSGCYQVQHERHSQPAAGEL